MCKISDGSNVGFSVVMTLCLMRTGKDEASSLILCCVQ
jgi:hypothetical protein